VNIVNIAQKNLECDVMIMVINSSKTGIFHDFNAAFERVQYSYLFFGYKCIACVCSMAVLSNLDQRLAIQILCLKSSF